MIRAAGRLYEQTLAPDERIPWVWIERTVANRERPAGRTADWVKHLILAAPEGRTDDPEALAGYVYGAYIPGYGGYLCYVGVADWARRMGVGTVLFEAFFEAVRADARAIGEPLPFVIWESHRPEIGGESLWAARTRLFDRVGGYWVEGVDFLSPNFASDDDLASVPLQLFVKPEDEPLSTFDPERLRELVAGLHELVYRNQPGDPLFDGTLTPDCEPELVPATDAGTVREDRRVLV
jgi:hypothetical protein